MAKLPVEVIDLRENQTADLSLAIEEANRVQSGIEFEINDALATDLKLKNSYDDTNAGSFFDDIIQWKAKSRDFHPFMIFFVDCALHSDKWRNLFSSRRAKDKEGVVIVTTHSVEKEIIPKGKMAAYFIYQLATHVLATIVSGKEHHRDIRECIYDFHEQKVGILCGIKLGKLCDECRKWFDQHGDLSPSQFRSIRELLKRSSELWESGYNVFIVHGHDDKAKKDVIGFAQALELNPIILDEQPSRGQTIIEKFEEHADKAGFAIILLTPDDVGEQKKKENKLKLRARQNVILELGYFFGKLGRKRVCLLSKKGKKEIELPSDIYGIVYVPMDDCNKWQKQLAEEMKEAGLPIDRNKL